MLELVREQFQIRILLSRALAVGTPNQQDGVINLELIEKASCEIGLALKEKKTYHLVVIKSTVAPTTTEKIVKPTIEKNSSKHCAR